MAGARFLRTVPSAGLGRRPGRCGRSCRRTVSRPYRGGPGGDYRRTVRPRPGAWAGCWNPERGAGLPAPQSPAHASLWTDRRVCSISSNADRPAMSGGASRITRSPRSPARQYRSAAWSASDRKPFCHGTTQVVLLGRLPGGLQRLAAAGGEEDGLEVAGRVPREALGTLDRPGVRVAPEGKKARSCACLAAASRVRPGRGRPAPRTARRERRGSACRPRRRCGRLHRARWSARMRSRTTTCGVKRIHTGP